MANRGYNYQYGTSPRKIKPDYTQPNKKTIQHHQTTKKSSTNKTKTATKKKISKKAKKKQEAKLKVQLFVKCVVLFGILFLIIFRNSQINEAFSHIQSLKSQITTIQKEKDQLEISIQNSLNANNIEQAAKDLLGMQKLTSKQTVYINVPKKDYVEPSTEKVTIEKDKNFWDNLIERIKNIF